MIAPDGWWVLYLVVLLTIVGVAEFRLGRKVGRREGYMEGHRHGVEDALGKLGVPVQRDRESTLVIDISKLVAEERLIIRGKGRPS